MSTSALAVPEPAVHAVNVTCVIPCKGRLGSLQQAVTLLLDQHELDGLHVLVVDYGCPQQTLEWCRQQRSPKLDCVKVLDRTETFHLSRARNCGNRIAQTELLVTLDADCLLKSHFIVRRMLDPILQGQGVSTIAGLIEEDGKSYPGQSYMAYKRSDWLKVRGYDEAMVDWGFEDTDFFMRIYALGPCQFLRAEFAEFERLQHSDEQRWCFYAERDLGLSWHKNKERSKRRTSVNPEGFAVYRYECFCGSTGRTTFGRFPKTRAQSDP